MAAKPPAKKKRRRKMRLTLKQKKMDPSKDSYSDSLGWSTQVGTTLTDAPKPKAPEKMTINVKCVDQFSRVANQKTNATQSSALTRCVVI